MESKKITAYYLRVSSAGQDMASQEDDMMAHSRSHNEPSEWFRDKFTGRKMDRPGWNKLMELVRAGRVSRIVVWRLDRIGRNVSGMSSLFTELRDRGVDLVSLREGINLNTVAGMLVAHVLASMAQFETEIRVERINAGIAAARKSGKRWGGGVVGRRTAVSDEQLAMIQKLKASGMGPTEIGKTIGLPKQTVFEYMR